MKKLLFLSLLPLSMLVRAQQEEHAAHSESFSPHHNVAFMVTHTHVSKGVKDGDRQWISLPSFALDYNYVFHPKWSVGLHNDIIFEDFIIEKESANGMEETIERSEPIVSVAVIGFQPGKHFIFQVGAGGEFEKEQNFFVTRLGVEYVWELPKHWELVGNLVYDIKWKGYDNWVLGIGVAKAFGFRNKHR
jgi:hypothetical protein